MSKFILNDDGNLKEVSERVRPSRKDYLTQTTFDLDSDLRLYEMYIASLREYQASPELLATMKVGDVVDERDIRCEQCYNYEDDAHYFTAYPRPKEGTGDGRFKMPTDEELIKAAILFNDGKLDQEQITKMVALCHFVTHRLYDNGDISIPAKAEK